jgi:multidrug efflux system membrane fusion protein
VTTTFVYVVNADSTVSVRPITLVIVQGDRAAVTAGLAAGEQVVTEGGDRLRDGAKVQLPQAAAAAPAAGPKPTGQARASGGQHRKRPRSEAQ